MNKNTIGAVIQADKDKIIAMYNGGVAISRIASEYNAKVDTICRRLRKWGIKIKAGDWYKKAKCKRFKQKFSPELLAKMKENSRINNERIQYVKFKRTTADQYLVHNIINHPIMTV